MNNVNFADSGGGMGEGSRNSDFDCGESQGEADGADSQCLTGIRQSQEGVAVIQAAAFVWIRTGSA